MVRRTFDLAVAHKPFVYLLDRIVGVTDDEILWEPVQGCLTVRDVEGRWVPDPPSEVTHFTHFDGRPAPFTTMAWRLAHVVCDVLGSRRNPLWLGVTDAPEPPTPVVASLPAGADAAVANLREAHVWWSAIVAGCDDEYLMEPMGEVAGRFDGPRVGFLSYINMELAHHSAEIGLLRDLWASGLR
ncbi:MAG TPA: DinB family protein [Acidimicrobiales bacterium]|nr:DinB family protein [Acidimicrobiales bacterium]